MLLVVTGVFSTFKLLRGLNQNVSLVSGSDIYDYFETLFEYGDAGPPGYVIFNNVDYSNTTLDSFNKTNLDHIKDMNA